MEQSVLVSEVHSIHITAQQMCHEKRADFDECVSNQSMCVDHSTCENTLGSYMCTCDSGFSGDGFATCSGRL